LRCRDAATSSPMRTAPRTCRVCTPAATSWPARPPSSSPWVPARKPPTRWIRGFAADSFRRASLPL